MSQDDVDTLARVFSKFTVKELTRAVKLYTRQVKQGKPRDPTFEEAARIAANDKVLEGL